MSLQVDLVLFMFLIFTLASVFLLVYIVWSGQEYEFSMDERIGVFGWMNRQADRLPLELFIAVICNGEAVVFLAYGASHLFA